MKAKLKKYLGTNNGQISSKGHHLLPSFPTAGEARGCLFIASVR